MEILNSTKTKAKEVQNKIADAEIKTQEINEKRLIFQPVAVRGSILYFSILEIVQVNWMYNTSLKQYLKLYNQAIDLCPKSTAPQKDVDFIIPTLTYIVYRYINRGLFEKDKGVFLLILCFKIQQTAQIITMSDIQLFLNCGNQLDKQQMKPKPNIDWLSD